MLKTNDEYLVLYDKAIILVSAMQSLEETMLDEMIPGDGVLTNDTCIIDKEKLDAEIKKMKDAIILNCRMPLTIAGRTHQRNINSLMRELNYKI